VIIGLLSSVLFAGAASAVVSALIVLSQRWHGKHTLDHDLDGVQKFHTSAVPRVGGIAIVAAIILTLLLGNLFVNGMLARDQLKQAGLLMLAGFPAFLAGTTEDLTKKVSVKVRLMASIASALMASWLLGTTVDGLDIWGVDTLLTWTPFALTVTAITVAGGVNAINIIDGFNGLAGCVVVIMLSALAAVGWYVGDPLVADLALIGVGATVGFLIVNYPKGRLFLGDGGAYFLGFWVAEIVVLLLVRNPVVNAWQALSICAYPVIEVLFSIYRRKIVRQASPGDPDGLHLHTLVYRRVVSRFIARDATRPWKRNAAVAFVMVPWIGLAALVSAVAGDSIIASMVIVLVQVFAYVAVYARLVRGRWFYRSYNNVSTPDNVNA
jgi:UDP-N-acetylmuramyl pentapeptide phosphotransferase/UDP-N-acetylglucosamine-1-phosphate transferase